jgi:hypothetical protein
MDFRGFSKHINCLIFRQLEMKILKIRKIQTSYIFLNREHPTGAAANRPEQDRPEQAQNQPQEQYRHKTANIRRQPSGAGAQPSGAGPTKAQNHCQPQEVRRQPSADIRPTVQLQ